MRRLEIGIAGCGPAGLAAALFLARAGHRVVLFERFAVPKPVGSGLMLQPTGMAVLAELGLLPAITMLGRRIDRMVGHAGRRLVLDVDYSGLGPGFAGLAMHRAALFQTLYDAVLAAGLPIELEAEIVGLERATDRRPVLVTREGRRHGPFDLVVDALGPRTPLGGELAGPIGERLLGYGALWGTVPLMGDFDPHALAQRYEAARIMIGVLPVGLRFAGDTPQATLFWSLKHADYERWRAAGLEAWKGEVLGRWPETAPLLDAIKAPEDMTLAVYRHRIAAKPYGDRIVAIGDAWRSTSPQLGQGANLAMIDACALAVALKGAADLPAALARYHAIRAFHVRLYHAASLVFTPFYQSDARIPAMIRDVAVKPATRVPGGRQVFAHLIAGTLGRPLKAMGLEPLALVSP